MKTALKSIAALLLLTACAQEIAPEKPDVKTNCRVITSITASLGDSNTRLTLDESDGKLYWDRGDCLCLIAGDSRAVFRMEGGEEASSARFEGSLELPEDFDGWIYCIYSDLGLYSFNGDNMQIPVTNGAMPEVFEGKPFNYFDNDPHMLPEEGVFPMVARSKDTNFSLHNICGGIKLTISKDNLFAVGIRNNDGGAIWGITDIHLDENGIPVVDNVGFPEEAYESLDEGEELTPDEFWMIRDAEPLRPGEPYYIVLPPVTFSEGMTVTYRTPSTIATYTVDHPFSIERNVFSRLTERDKDLEFKPLDGNISFFSDQFKAYCVQNFDEDGDGEISFREALNVKKISYNGNASKLEDIDLMYFENLEVLQLRGDSAEDRRYIHSIPVGYFHNLKYLDCTYNRINSLDLSKCPELKMLLCGCNEISELDLSNNPNISRLQCNDNNLTSLDVSGLTKLDTLAFHNNGLEHIDLSNNTELTYIACYHNNLQELDITPLAKLEQLRCHENEIPELNVAACPRMIVLSCGDNKLKNLDLKVIPHIYYLWCYRNDIPAIDASDLTSLEFLSCFGNGMESLDVSGCSNLKFLYCYNNGLPSLDISDNPELAVLSCSNNYFPSLDVSHNPKLEDLHLVYDWWWDWEWDAVYYPESYDNPLKFLYIAEGQEIPNITSDRSEQYIPYTTVVTTYPIEGNPHSDLFGTYIMSAYNDLGESRMQTMEWTMNLSEYEDDYTKMWIGPTSLLIFYMPGYFDPSSDAFAYVRGDGKAFRIPLPQKLACTADIFDSQYTGVPLYLYSWEGSSPIGGSFKNNKRMLEFTLQEDGTFKADRSFGTGLDYDAFSNFYQPLWWGMVNYCSDEYPVTIRKNE